MDNRSKKIKIQYFVNSNEKSISRDFVNNLESVKEKNRVETFLTNLQAYTIDQLIREGKLKPLKSKKYRKIIPKPYELKIKATTYRFLVFIEEGIMYLVCGCNGSLSNKANKEKIIKKYKNQTNI